MITTTWSKLFDDWTEAKMVVLEGDRDRRGIYESEVVWNYIINFMYQCEVMSIPDNMKIQRLIRCCNINMLFPLNQVTKRTRMVKMISETKDKIKYYQNNPEEE